MIPVAYNLRNLAVRKTTTVAAATGLALVVFFLSAIIMFSSGLESALRRSARPDVAIVLAKGTDGEIGSRIADSALGVVIASPEVARDASGRPAATPEVSIGISLRRAGGGLTSVQLRGVVEGATVLRPAFRLVAGRKPRPGTDEAVVGRALRGRFEGLDVGGSLELPRKRPLRIVGIFEDGGSAFESEVWGDLDYIRGAFGFDATVSALRVRLASPSLFPAFRARLEADKLLGVQALRETDYFERQSGGRNLLVQAVALLIVVLFSVGAMIGATITMHASVAHRRREIATLRAIGFSRSSVLVSFLVESTLVALGGGATGALAALALGLTSATVVNPASGTEIVFSFEPTPAALAWSLGVAVCMGLLGGLVPAFRAAMEDPATAMRG